jgi:hypothetical protein
MKSMELSCVRFDFSKDLGKQRNLFKECFQETNGDAIQSEAHYIWKFHTFPNDAHSWEYACYKGREIIGYYAALPYRYKIGSKITRVGMVCDVMTSIKHRGKGVFVKMGNYAIGELTSEVPFTTGYPIRKEVIPGHLRAGWKIAFNMPLYIKFIRINAVFKNRNIGLFAFLINPMLFIYNCLIKTKIDKGNSYELGNNINEVKGYDSFVNKWIDSVPNALVKDLQFARWRYGAPERNYKFISVRNKTGMMIGFVSFRFIVKNGVPCYGILDYMILPGHEDCHGLINKVLMDSANKDNVEVIITMMSKTSAINYKICKNGFIKSPFTFKFILKKLTNQFTDKELFGENNWHLMWVDSDDL